MTVSVANTGTGQLTNLSAALSGANADAFDIVLSLEATLTSGETADFSVRAKDGLAAGTYTATVTISADQLTDETFTVTQSVNLPNAPANPQNLAAARGDRMVLLTWTTVTEAAYYNLYMSTTPGQFGDDELATVTNGVYVVPNLMNGTMYYFVVKSGNLGGLSGASNQAGATPATVPAAPTNVSAVAGDGQATITFTAPTDHGGSEITEYAVTDSSYNIVATGTTDTTIVVTGLTNGTSYVFAVIATNDVGSGAPSSLSNAVVPRSTSSDSSDSGDSGNPYSGGAGAPATAPNNTNTGAVVLVNGKEENAGTATTGQRNDQTVTTISVDHKMLDDKLAAEGLHAVVTIPINTKSDVAIGELNGQMVKSMETKQAILEIKTDRATYTLPAAQINIDAISGQLGSSLDLQDIKIQVEIGVPPAETVKVVENAAADGSFAIVVPPMEFTVRATYGDQTVEVSKFNAYVERTVAIPEGVDPNKITTGVVVDPDGTVRHVPTKIVMIDGKYYAKINSLTNSTYSVVWHPLEFKDVKNHWAENAVNDMGSRMIITGLGSGLFKPDQDVTRAEFAAMMVRALGLQPENGQTPFPDVQTSDWYGSAIHTAYAYRLIDGFEDGTFRPDAPITRGQAMVILAHAMTITKLKERLPVQGTGATLQIYADAADISGWALSGVADAVQAGVVSGRNGAKLALQEYITRAEAAAMLQRLLQKSELID